MASSDSSSTCLHRQGRIRLICNKNIFFASCIMLYLKWVRQSSPKFSTPIIGNPKMFFLTFFILTITIPNYSVSNVHNSEAFNFIMSVAINIYYTFICFPIFSQHNHLLHYYSKSYLFCLDFFFS